MKEQFLATILMSTKEKNGTEMRKVIDVNNLAIKQGFIEMVHGLGRGTISEEDYNKYEKAKQQWDDEKTINNICNLAQTTQQIFEKLEQRYKNH